MRREGARTLAVALMAGLLTAPSGSLAEEPAAPPNPAPLESVQSPAPSSTPKTKPRKGRKTREKEAEGTEAPDRFEADTVIKSQYQLDGDPLEVDPD